MDTQEKFKIFSYNGSAVKVKLEDYFSDEWISVLGPLFNSEYCNGLMYYLYHYFNENKEHAKILRPATMSDLFTPFRLTAPSDIRVVLFTDQPASTVNSTGVGFGGGTIGTNPTLSLHHRNFNKEIVADGYVHRIDNTLHEWLEEGVLVLNIKPLIASNVPSFHDRIFLYFYECVLTYLAALNKDLIVASVTTVGNRFIGEYDKGLNQANIVTSNDYFSEVDGGLSIYSKINTKLLANGNRPIKWTRTIRDNFYTT